MSASVKPALRVLHVVPAYFPATIYGGPIFSIHATAEALARRGIDVRVATTNANGATKLAVETRTPVVLGENYRVRYYDDTVINRFSWAFTRGVGRDIREADVVHLQDVFSAHAAETLAIAAALKKPLLLSARGVMTRWGLAGKRPWLKKAWLGGLVGPLTANSARVVWHATAESEREEIQAVFPAARVVVIPNGIDLSAYGAARGRDRAAWIRRFWPDAPLDPETGRVLVGMGRLHPKKSFEVAIEALSLLDGAPSQTVLALAGADDGDAERLAGISRRLGTANRVAFLGELKGEAKRAFLEGADLFLFPSHNENFGMVALEALAAGLPVIASRNTPWCEVAAFGCGASVENEPRAFAAAAVEALAGDRDAMSAAARRLAAEYDLGVVAEKFRETYVELINGRTYH